MSGFIEVEIEPAHMSSAGRRWIVRHGGKVIIESTRDPEHAAARALLEMGADIDDIAVFRHAGAAHHSMMGRIGFLAATATSEGQGASAHTIPWQPFQWGGGEDAA